MFTEYRAKASRTGSPCGESSFPGIASRGHVADSLL